MEQYNIHKAKTHLSRLVHAAAEGEVIVIAKAGVPLAKLVAVGSREEPRVLGTLAGAVREAEDCWAPDPELERLFYGGDPGILPQAKVAERPSPPGE